MVGIANRYDIRPVHLFGTLVRYSVIVNNVHVADVNPQGKIVERPVQHGIKLNYARVRQLIDAQQKVA